MEARAAETAEHARERDTWRSGNIESGGRHRGDRRKKHQGSALERKREESSRQRSSRQRAERRRSRESTAGGRGTQMQTQNIEHAGERKGQQQS